MLACLHLNGLYVFVFGKLGASVLMEKLLKDKKLKLLFAAIEKCKLLPIENEKDECLSCVCGSLCLR